LGGAPYSSRTDQRRIGAKANAMDERGDLLEETRLPKFDYYLDESDPDIAVLKRQDGTFVAAFSARGFTKEGVVKAAKEDYRALLDEHTPSADGAAE
jgi:hypothetical protein